MIAKHLVIRGRVQGVGYRDAMREQARRFGIAGWVRNRYDGSVEAHVQGAEPAVTALIAWARHGPPPAQVAVLNVQEASLREDLEGTFARLPTA